MKMALYRHFDAENRLLYVGVSLDPLSRTQQHRAASDWFSQIARIQIEWFDTREAACKAERRAIIDERPAKNKRHQVLDGDSVEAFIAQANRDDFVQETGFAQQSVSRAISENLMPSSWYRDVRDFCAPRGLPVPDHLFRWIDKRKSSDKPREAAE